MFTKFQIVAAQVTLTAGKLRLTPDQFRRRAHRLTATGKRGEYTIDSPVNFKAGEIIEFDGQVPKALADDLETQQAAKEKAAAEAKQREAAEQERARAEFLADLKGKVSAAGEAVKALQAEHDAATGDEAKAAVATKLAEAQAVLEAAQADLAQVGG